MGEPNTEWGRQAVSDIESLKLDVMGVKSSVDAMRLEFVEFRAQMRVAMAVIVGGVAVFGVMIVTSWAKLADTTARLDERIGGVERSVDALSGRVEGLSDRVDGIADRMSRAEGKLDALAVAVGPGASPSAVEPLHFDPRIDRAGGEDEDEPPLELPIDPGAP